MMTRRTGFVCMIVLCTFAGRTPTAPAQVASAERFSLGLRGVYFVENHGQWSDAGVAYGFKSRGLDIAFRDSSFTMHLSRGIEDATNASRGKGSAPPRIPFVDEWEERQPLSAAIRGGEDSAPAYEHLTLTVSFPGSNPVTPRGAQPQEAKFNYYIGDDESRWASNVPSFGAIVYENLYDGVDLHIRGNDHGVLKYEFHVAPSADYSQIRIAYNGIDSLCVDESGDLRITTSFGTLTDSAPLVWQEDVDSTSRAREEAGSTPSPGFAGEGRGGGDRTTIPARFELVDATTYRFALAGPVDPARALIIDPDVEWSYYLGGGGWDVGHGAAADALGSVYLSGQTQSLDLIRRTNSHHGGPWDAFIAKVDYSGELAWMTYLGGSRNDWGEAAAADADGNVYSVGQTQSADFAGANNAQPGGHNGFLAKVDPNGSVLWMTYVGGLGPDRAFGVAVDDAGAALVAGETESAGFIGRLNSHHGGRFDTFVLRVDAAGSTEWMTYLGGARNDHGRDIIVGPSGEVLITGETESDDFIARINSRAGSFDAFMAEVSGAGAPMRTVYVGGNRQDFGRGIAVESDGSIWLTGSTLSTVFEGSLNSLHSEGIEDAFVVRLNPDGSVAFMRYMGGTDEDYGNGVVILDTGSVLIAGQTRSRDFEGRVNEFLGQVDLFSAEVNRGGELSAMVYLGGQGWDECFDVVLGAAGTFTIGGSTLSTDLPGQRNSFIGGTWNGFVLTQIPYGHLRLELETSCPRSGPFRVGWSGATPRGTVAMLVADGFARSPVPDPFACPGVQLRIGSGPIAFVGDKAAGPEGSRTLTGVVRSAACGRFLQLLDVTACRTSNVVRIE